MVCSRESDVESALLTKMAVRQSAMVLAVREGAHRKHCLSTIFQNPAVQENIDAILKENVASAPATYGLSAKSAFRFCKNGEEACRHVYENMVIWQNALLALNDTALFYNPLLSSDVSKAPECPSWVRIHAMFDAIDVFHRSGACFRLRLQFRPSFLSSSWDIAAKGGSTPGLYG